MENLVIEQYKKHAPGLQRTIYFGLVSDVETWPDQSTPSTYEDLGRYDSGVVMKTGKQMWEFKATVGKNSLTTKNAGQRGSMSASNTVSITRAWITARILGFLKAHQNDELFLIVSDQGSRPYFIGAEEFPVHITEYELPTGASTEDGVDCKISFENMGQLALEYGSDASPLTIPLTPAS